MTPLRAKMIEDMQLRGLSDATRQQYVLLVRQFALHHGRSPDQLGAPEVRAFLLHLRTWAAPARRWRSTGRPCSSSIARCSTAPR